MDFCPTEQTCINKIKTKWIEKRQEFYDRVLVKALHCNFEFNFVVSLSDEFTSFDFTLVSNKGGKLW